MSHVSKRRVLLIKTDNPYLQKLYSSSTHHHKGDAGFDVYIPDDYHFAGGIIKKSYKMKGESMWICGGFGVKMNLDIKCEAYEMVTYCYPGGGSCKKVPISFMLFPRSSMGKTPLRLSNSIGLIDSGYRGELVGVVDNISKGAYKVEKGTRLFQIVFSDLVSADEIKILAKGEELSQTSRGEEGFGSTSKNFN